jgi:flagellar biosynthesis protein FlhG
MHSGDQSSHGLRAGSFPFVAIASGKGGVGKTWLSITLAHAFARRGERVLLADCDFGLANIDVQLGLRPQSDLSAVLRGWISVEDAITPVNGGPSRQGGFDLLPGHSGSGQLAGLKPDDLAQIAAALTRIAPYYDRVLLDCGSGLDAGVMRFACAADQTLIVTTEDPTALTDAYAFSKVLRARRPDAIPGVVINMAETRASGRRIYDQFAKACENFLKFRPSLCGVICRDPRVGDAIRAQTILPVRHPNATAFEEVARLAAALSHDPRLSL